MIRSVGASSNPMWIDCLSINQDDLEEKAIQVDQMTTIYERSQQTIVWLGEGNMQFEKLMADFEHIGSEAVALDLLSLDRDDMSSWPAFKDSPSGGKTAAAKTKIMEGVDQAVTMLRQKKRLVLQEHAAIAVFARFTYLEWFSRVWIVQELCVPPKVLFKYGERLMDYETFLAAFLVLNLAAIKYLRGLTDQSDTSRPLWLRFSRFVVNTGWRILWNAFWGEKVDSNVAWPSARAAITLGSRKAYRRAISKASLPISERDALGSIGHGHLQPTLKDHLIRAFKPTSGGTLNASNPRDRIFAFVGISRDAHSLDIRANYQIPTEEVYREVARKMLQNGDVEILNYCQPDPEAVTSESAPSLPSWAPDWRQELQEPWGRAAHDGLYQACGPAENWPEPASNDRVLAQTELTLQGILVDRIGAWYNPSGRLGNDPNGPVATPGISRWFGLVNSIETFLQYSRYDEPTRAEGRWRIPLGDRELNALGIVVRASDVARQQFVTFRQAFKSTDAMSKMLLGFSTVGIIAMISEYETARTFFTAEEKYVGIGPQGLQNDDEVWVVRGAHVPYVFRRMASGKYRLLGESYVHGIMDGEILEREGVKSQWLLLE